MNTGYITHHDCLQHDTGEGHPECARRLTAIQDRLMATQLYDFLRHFDAPQVTREQLLRVHSEQHLEAVIGGIPEQGYAHLDPDTVVSPASLEAAYRAAGSVCQAVDLILAGDLKNAFCAVRPPGHHAERQQSMGFCLFDNIAVGAAHALEHHGLERVAIVDFDVHQGNGTQDIFLKDRRVLFCSTFQHPFYPYTTSYNLPGHLVSVPLEATAKGVDFRDAIKREWLPELERFKPQMLFISAGFDAHQDDDMSGVSLNDADYQWISKQLMDIANRHCDGHVVSALEGGYEIHSLARCVEIHIRSLMGLN